MKVEIKPKNCPLCGGSAEIIEHSSKKTKVYSVSCIRETCGLTVTFYNDNAVMSPIKTIDAWRRRTKAGRDGRKASDKELQMSKELTPPKKLKPCPFCGNINLNYRGITFMDFKTVSIEKGYNAVFIHCGQCGASSAIEAKDEEEFIDKWNRRDDE